MHELHLQSTFKLKNATDIIIKQTSSSVESKYSLVIFKNARISRLLVCDFSRQHKDHNKTKTNSAVKIGDMKHFRF